MTLDTRFAGSIPASYNEFLVPILFEPYAEDLVARAAALDPRRVLELAAGTGAVSHLLAAALPHASIVATDLNAAMLDVAARRGTWTNLAFQPADAQALPFDASAFDLVAAQFGVMFFPDRVGAYREARRVLARGGTFLFNAWDRLEANSGSAAIHAALREVVPDPKPDFIARTPFSYNDPGLIEQELRSAGFDRITIDRVERVSPAGSGAQLARGMCTGSPLANELALHSAEVRERALHAAMDAAERAEAVAPLTMAALVVTAG